MKKKRIVIGLSLLCLAGMTGCSSGSKEAGTKETEAKKETEIKQDIDSTANNMGTFTPANTTSVTDESMVPTATDSETILITDVETEGYTENEMSLSDIPLGDYGVDLPDDYDWDAEENETDNSVVMSGYDSTVELCDYKNLDYTPTTIADVTDEDVEAKIEELLLQHPNKPQYQQSGTVAEGDYVKVTFRGYIDGVLESNLEGADIETQVGSGTLLADFEQQLIGLEIGQETTFSVTYPDDYWVSQIAGVEVEYDVAVTARADVPPETTLTDDWVVTNTGFTTVEEYRRELKQYLKGLAVEEAKQVDIALLLDELIQNSTYDLAYSDISAAKEQEISAYQAEASYYGLTYNEYVEQQFGYTDIDEFEDSVETAAKSNIKSGLAISAVIAEEHLDISDSAYQKYLDEMAEINGYEDGKAYEQAMLSSFIDYYDKNIFEDRVVGEYLISANSEKKGE